MYRRAPPSSPPKSSDGDSKDTPVSTWTNLKVDTPRIVLLLVLYTLQGIPMGLSGSIPFLMQGRGVSYHDLSLFSLVSLPFSFKLLWAPMVDFLYWPGLGRRRSWVVPIQMITGGVMYFWSDRVATWLGEFEGNDHPPDVKALTVYFIVLYALMATQDIAVDGWALTMLAPVNRSFASPCNTIGQTLGYLAAHVGFLALHDPSTCNKWFRYQRKDYGLVTIDGFLRFWGIVMILTTLIVLFIPEKDEEDVIQEADSLPESLYVKKKTSAIISEPPFDPLLPVDNAGYLEESFASASNVSLLASYRNLVILIRRTPVQKLAAVLLTCRMASAVTESATHLKLIEKGMTKEELALFSPLIVPFAILCPIVVGKYTASVRPLRVFKWGVISKLFMSLVWAGVLPLTELVYRDRSTSPPSLLWFYAVLYVVFALYNICSDFMFVSQMSFAARVSDPKIGGTYMTFLNTVANLGAKWPVSLCLFIIDDISRKNEKGTFSAWHHDGYFRLLPLCLGLGAVWLLFFSPILRQLEEVSREEWLIQGDEVSPRASEGKIMKEHKMKWKKEKFRRQRKKIQ